MKILVADDNVDIADSVGTFLELCGHEVSTAYDGETACEQARTFQPDAVVLDIRMPGKNGFEVARYLRAELSLSDVCLVAVTGQSSDAERGEASRAGFDHYLIKPISPYGILDILDDNEERNGRGISSVAARTGARFAYR